MGMCRVDNSLRKGNAGNWEQGTRQKGRAGRPGNGKQGPAASDEGPAREAGRAGRGVRDEGRGARDPPERPGGQAEGRGVRGGGEGREKGNPPSFGQAGTTAGGPARAGVAGRHKKAPGTSWGGISYVLGNTRVTGKRLLIPFLTLAMRINLNQSGVRTCVAASCAP